MRRLYQFLAGILAIIFFLWGISAYMQSRTGNVSDKLVIYNLRYRCAVRLYH